MKLQRYLLPGVLVTAGLVLAGPEAAAQRPPHSGGGGGSRVAAPAGGGGRMQAVPRDSRPRGDRPTVGTAVPRGPLYPGYRPGYPPSYRPYYGWGYRPYYGGYYPYYGYGYYGYPYYGYPYYGYPYYGYGFGFGLSFYYGPFGFGFGAPWYGYNPYGWSGYGAYGSGYGYGGSGGGGAVDYPTGDLKLTVTPKKAQVYVDGYFVGSVEDFDGWSKHLTLKAGPDPGEVHRIEIRQPGYETLSFEVRATPGQSVTYRGELKKVQ